MTHNPMPQENPDGSYRPIRSVFIDEKKLSIAALSQTLPDRLIEQVTPLSAITSAAGTARSCIGRTQPVVATP